MVIHLQVAAGAGEAAWTRAESPGSEVGDQLAAALDALRGEIAAIRIAADCLLVCIRELAHDGATSQCSCCGRRSA